MLLFILTPFYIRYITRKSAFLGISIRFCSATETSYTLESLEECMDTLSNQNVTDCRCVG